MSSARWQKTTTVLALTTFCIGLVTFAALKAFGGDRVPEDVVQPLPPSVEVVYKTWEPPPTGSAAKSLYLVLRSDIEPDGVSLQQLRRHLNSLGADVEEAQHSHWSGSLLGSLGGYGVQAGTLDSFLEARRVGEESLVGRIATNVEGEGLILMVVFEM